jgi:hypothetical protein
VYVNFFITGYLKSHGIRRYTMEVPFWTVVLVAFLFIGGLVLLSIFMDSAEKKKTATEGNSSSDKP